jgi:Zn-dependent M28 family amino/carboxypeptidase
MREAGLDSFENSLLKIFNGITINRSNLGMNIVGWIKGSQYPDKFIAITAHFDHEGIKNEETYYGASDNASGTACLLGLAKYFKQNPHSYSLLFVAFDREETGLEGSRHFCNNIPFDTDKLKFNLNIDMIARNDKNEIFACGPYHYPAFMNLVNETQQKTNARLLMGHDYGEGPDNWTPRSDHYPFHLKEIPFIYIGVEDHPDLHKPTDTFEKIDLSTYIENCNMVAMMIRHLNP